MYKNIKVVMPTDSTYTLKCACGATEFKIIKEALFNRLGAKDYYFEILECKKCKLRCTYPVPCNKQYIEDVSYNTVETEDTWSKQITKDLSILCKQGSNILDIGCYTGNLVEILKSYGFKTTGCDIDPVAIGKGLALGRNIKFGSLEKCKFENDFFDAIICNHSLEHIIELYSTIYEIRRILKNKGLLFIITPYFKGVIPKIMNNNWIGWFPQQHVWHFNKNTLQQVILKYGGFKVKSIKSKGLIEPPSLGLKGLLKRIIGRTAGFLNFGDEIEAIFIKQ